MTPELYCQEKAAPIGSSMYYSTLFHKTLEKRYLHALFAFQQELIDAVMDCQDAGVARIKLQWWCEEIDRIFSAQSRHPLGKELQTLLPELQLDQGALLRLVNVVELEINPEQSDSLPQLVAQFSDGRGRLWSMAALACAYEEQEKNTQIEKIAGLVNCLNYLQAARRQLDRGYCPFPRVEMENCTLDHDDLLQPESLENVSELSANLFTFIHSELKQCILGLENNQNKLPLFSLSQAHIALGTCSLLKGQAISELDGSLTISPIRKLWIAWRSKISA